MGDHRVTCAAGLLAEDRDCGPGLCYTPSIPVPPVCVASTTPDPRCTAIQPAGAATAYGCDGNTLFQCLDGLYGPTTDCGINECRATASSAGCYVKL